MALRAKRAGPIESTTFASRPLSRRRARLPSGSDVSRSSDSGGRARYRQRVSSWSRSFAALRGDSGRRSPAVSDLACRVSRSRARAQKADASFWSILAAAAAVRSVAAGTLPRGLGPLPEVTPGTPGHLAGPNGFTNRFWAAWAWSRKSSVHLIVSPFPPSVASTRRLCSGQPISSAKRASGPATPRWGAIFTRHVSGRSE